MMVLRGRSVHSVGQEWRCAAAAPGSQGHPLLAFASAARLFRLAIGLKRSVIGILLLALFEDNR